MDSPLFMQYSNNISSLYCTCFKCWNVGHKEPGQVQGWTTGPVGRSFWPGVSVPAPPWSSEGWVGWSTESWAAASTRSTVSSSLVCIARPLSVRAPAHCKRWILVKSVWTTLEDVILLGIFNIIIACQKESIIAWVLSVEYTKKKLMEENSV